MELREFESEKETWNLNTIAEKMEYALKYKDKGNVLFKQGKYSRASKRYTKAAGYIEYDHDYSDEEKASAKQLKLSCHLNNAMCKLKLESFKEALDASEKALSIDPNALKGLYRSICYKNKLRAASTRSVLELNVSFYCCSCCCLNVLNTTGGRLHT